jgi:hypothetical protein
MNREAFLKRAESAPIHHIDIFLNKESNHPLASIRIHMSRNKGTYGHSYGAEYYFAGRFVDAFFCHGCGYDQVNHSFWRAIDGLAESQIGAGFLEFEERTGISEGKSIDQFLVGGNYYRIFLGDE